MTYSDTSLVHELLNGQRAGALCRVKVRTGGVTSGGVLLGGEYTIVGQTQRATPRIHARIASASVAETVHLETHTHTHLL